MNETERATFIQAQAACAIIEAFGMISENMRAANNGRTVLPYSKYDFDVLINQYGIHQNATIGYLKGL